MSVWTTSWVLEGGQVTRSDTVNILNGRPVRGFHNAGAAALTAVAVFQNGDTFTFRINSGDWIELAAKRINSTGSDAGVDTDLRWFI